MKLLAVLSIIILLVGFVSTMALSGQGDDNYQESTKRNITNLTLLYVALGVICTIGIALYIWL